MLTQIQIQGDLGTSGMIFSHQLNQLSEDLEETRSKDEKMTEKVDEATVTELNAEVSNWTSFPTSLAASTQTLGIFVPRSATSPNLSLIQQGAHLWTHCPTLTQVRLQR